MSSRAALVAAVTQVSALASVTALALSGAVDPAWALAAVVAIAVPTDAGRIAEFRRRLRGGGE